MFVSSELAFLLLPFFLGIMSDILILFLIRERYSIRKGLSVTLVIMKSPRHFRAVILN